MDYISWNWRVHDVETVWEVIERVQKQPELSHLEPREIERELLACWNADQRTLEYFTSKTECEEVIEDIKKQFIEDILREEY
jgi:hypothetical protein